MSLTSFSISNLSTRREQEEKKRLEDEAAAEQERQRQEQEYLAYQQHRNMIERISKVHAAKLREHNRVKGVRQLINVRFFHHSVLVALFSCS
jgi:hypothetical protein